MRERRIELGLTLTAFSIGELYMNGVLLTIGRYIIQRQACDRMRGVIVSYERRCLSIGNIVIQPISERARLVHILDIERDGQGLLAIGQYRRSDIEDGHSRR